MKTHETREETPQGPSACVGVIFRVCPFGINSTSTEVKLGSLISGVPFRNSYLFGAACQSLSTASICHSKSLYLVVLSTLLPVSYLRTLG